MPASRREPAGEGVQERRGGHMWSSCGRPGGGGNSRKLNDDVTGGFVADSYFNTVDPVDRGVAGGGPAEHFHACAGQKSQMRQMVAHVFSKLNPFHNSGLAYPRLA